MKSKRAISPLPINLPRFLQWHSLALLIIILLGFGIRMVALERQSMWTDEGLSLYRSGLSIAGVLSNTIIIDGVATNDPNPPLYFLLLNLWRRAAGESITAMRTSGALFGVLSIPLMYLLGTAVNGRRVGILSALLIAISPFHVWQSQILRNYSLLITFNLISIYGLIRYLSAADKKTSIRWLVLWAAAGLFSIYTHYFGAFVFAYSLIPLAISFIHQWGIRRVFKQKWLWVLWGLVTLITIPGLSLAYTHFRAGQQIDFFPVPLIKVMEQAASAFAVGVDRSLFHPWTRYLPALLAAFIGVIISWYRERMMALLMLGYQFVPLGLLLLLSAINPLYNGVRHLLIGLPPFIIFVAIGIAAPLWGKKNAPATGTWLHLQQWGRWLLGLFVFGVQIGWLIVQFSSPNLLRDDIRGAAQYLNQTANAGDIIILHDTIIGATFDYYYDGPAPWQSIPELDQFDVEEAKNLMMMAGENNRRVWFLAEPKPRTGFPRDVLGEWADENWVSFYAQKYPWMWLKVNLIGYVADPIIASLPQNAVPVGATFRQDLRLDGVEMDTIIRGGEIWPISWYITSLNPQPGNYTLSLRLIDDQGKVWQQIDQALWDTYPPIVWPSGKTIQYHQFSNMPAGIPPGNYRVVVRILDNEAQTLALEDERLEVYIGDVQVESPGTNAEDLPLYTPQYSKMGPLSLLGYQLSTNNLLRPGHLLPLSLFWQTRRVPEENYQVKVELLDTNGVVAEITTPLTRDSYPPKQWQKNEILQGFANLIIPATAVSDDYAMRITLVTPAGQPASKPVTLLSEILVEEWPLETTLPPVARPMAANIGNPPVIQLRGIDLPKTTFQPGELLPLTLVWQADSAPDINYAVFVHVLGEDENIVAQQDGMPVQGIRPTAGWRSDEVIIDQHDLYLDPGIPPGSYQLYVGLYNPETGERPFTQLDGKTLPDGRIPVGVITLEAEQ